ncbi:MAG: S1 RNA-binding domain-containing protein [Polyangiales bacterium]
MSDPKTDDSFASLFEQQSPRGGQKPRPRLAVGARVEGPVVQITRDAVFIDLDEKRQGYLDRTELLGADGALTVKVGDRLAASVVEVDARTGNVRLGRSLGKAGDVASLELAREQGLAVEGKVVAINKGGAEVEVGSTKAFCPVSQLDNRFVPDPSAFVGKSLRFRVTEVREGGRKVVLSRRLQLEAEGREAAERVLATLTVGATVKGPVTGVREFGAFVDLGGVEGLVPLSELSHDSAVRAADVVKPGDVVEVQVKEVRPGENGATPKITLSLKALSADPWEALSVVAPVGRVVAGTVTRVVDFGAFVRIAAGVEGLLHVSELSGRPEHPSKVFSTGQPVMVVVKSADAQARKVSLTLAPDGAAAGGTVSNARVVAGAVVKATVERIEPYGVFAQVEGTRGRAGRGLIPNAELGIPRGADVRKHFPEGTVVTAKVIETGEGRLRMSIKGVREDEERAAYEGYQGSQAVSGKLGTLGDLLKNRGKR